VRGLFLPALVAFLLTPEPQAAGPLSQEPLFAGVRLYYGPADGFETVDARLIEGARRSIDMAAYVLTDRALATALRRAASRGVKVRVYLDGEEMGRRAPIEDIADAPNLEVRRKGRSRDLMHMKSYQIDGRTLRTGSANFSVSGEVYQDNDLIVIESPPAAARFREIFERLWARADNQRIGFK
jgi:phosphatidylserine/phosphatidylglycerophosphate/cardiolipin synthase-like enzyme